MKHASLENSHEVSGPDMITGLFMTIALMAAFVTFFACAFLMDDESHAATSANGKHSGPSVERLNESE